MDYVPILSWLTGLAALCITVFGHILAKRNKRLEAIEKKVENVPLLQQQMIDLKERLTETREQLEKFIDLALQRPRL